MSATAKWQFAKSVLLVAVVAAAGACSKPAEDSVDKTAQDQARQVAFSRDLEQWRSQRVANLTRPDGWTSVVGLHWIDPGPHYFGASAGNGIQLAVGPEHFGMIDLNNGHLRFVPEKGLVVTLDGEPLKGATELRADDSPTGPSVLAFDEGKGLVTVIKRGDRYALRVKHADAQSRTGFRGIEYWPASTDWKVQAHYVPHPPGKTLPIANIIGITEEVPNPGALEFERGGKQYRIEALDEGADTLFLVFADRTSGHGSYPAGRFLDAPKPGADASVTLDFNQAYNPPCAFTAFATCPLPPPENRLDLAINAGEKTYAHATP
ncbi:DUF1684 domain-containing protein [Lysobacter sp. S4-A87]|uniref:DUF1684 domain-containing protein n=1 Tax=Lysobacter sp. S4-A87 TaxID=2925843 RepID=UPI001F530FDC|nr:DUF1684 domain-containing protein [Lysobacter sp. S4-A87]UNK50236.1 DUF1684 domain-containing protein [Lysobacter sp. S4-A87]